MKRDWVGTMAISPSLTGMSENLEEEIKDPSRIEGLYHW